MSRLNKFVLQAVKKVQLKVVGPFIVLLFLPNVMAQQTEELKDIQSQIQQKQKQIERQLANAKVLQTQLKQAELNISNTAKSLNVTRNSLKQNTTKQLELTQQQTSLKKQQKQQQSALAEQLKSMYMAGDYDYAKMLFNLDDASRFERTLSYYQYLNQARKTQIDTFRALVAQIQQVTLDLQEKQAELLVLEKEQRQQREKLKQQQDQRQQTLVKIENQINSEAAQIEQLQINEQALIKAIEEAERIAQQRPLNLTGFAKLRGKLTKPTEGRLRKMFGRSRQGQVKWKGVLFNGNTGASVKAIHDGRVLYANWLRGFGLVTVLDHGDGYMSLYGHNQALLKNVGDEVQSGETIALVGQSGGQSSPNLYFEIRHKGLPVNPVKWLRL